MEKKSDREIIESAFSPEQLGRLEKLLHDIYQSHVDSVVLGYRIAESEVDGTIELLSSSNLQLKRDAQFFIAEAKKHREKYEKLVEGLGKLERTLTLGETEQFYDVRYDAIESLITEIERGDNGKAEG